MQRLPAARFTFVAGSSRARSSSDRGRSANAAGPASNVPCPWHARSCRVNRQQRDATSPRIRDARPPCCARLSWEFSHCWPTNVGYYQHGDSPRHPQPDNGTGTKKRPRCLYFIAVPPLKVRGHVQIKLSSHGIYKASCDRNKDRRLDVEQRSPHKTPEELSNESAKSESRRSRWSARRRRPAEPEPATGPADTEARTGRTARRSRWRARWWPENLVSSFGRFSLLSPASAGLFLMRCAACG
jgi:hypothetical protein